MHTDVLSASMSVHHMCARSLWRPEDPLEVELRTVVSCYVGAGVWAPGPVEEQPVILTTEPSL